MRCSLLRACAPVVLLAVMVLLGPLRKHAAAVEIDFTAAATRLPLRGTQELGNTFEGFAAANWSLAHYRGTKFALSFIPRRDGMLKAIWLCWKTAKGYGAGTLGIWTFELQTDDDAHRPSGEVIARVEGMTQPPDGCWRIALPPVALAAGHGYHLVAYNTDHSKKRKCSVQDMPSNTITSSLRS